MDQRTFGALVAELRTQARNPHRPGERLSIRGLAASLGVDHSTVSRIEHGTLACSADLAARLDTTLGAQGRIVSAAATLPRKTTSRPSAVSTQLPPEQPLIGRSEEIKHLLHRVDSARADGQDYAAPPVLLLSGPGGVGKTALGLALAHRLAPAWPDGAVWADLRGWDEDLPPRPMDGVLQSWCRALGVSSDALAGDVEELLATWRATVADRALVIVADNATPEQIDSLIPSSPRSVVIATTRHGAVDIANAIQHDVTPLNDDHARQLLASVSGLPEVVLAPLVPLCAGIPLALRVAALDARHHWTSETINVMVRHYAESDELNAVDRAARRSMHTLDAEVRHTWLLCALTGGTVSLGHAAALAGIAPSTTRRHLNAAVDACLLDRDDGGWKYPDLHLAFARREAGDTISAGDRDTAVYRGLTWWIHGMARAAVPLAGRDDTPLHLVDLPAEVQLPVIHGYDEAMAWMDAHWLPSTVPVVSAIDRGWVRVAWQLVATPLNYAFLTTPSSWDTAAIAALDAAERARDIEGIAWMHMVRGSVAGERGDVDRAIRHLNTSLELRRSLGPEHRRDIGWSAINIARWALVAGRADDEILPFVEEGDAAHTAIGYPAGQVLATAFRGALAFRRQEYTTAEGFLRDAVARTPDAGDPAITVFATTWLADTLVHLAHRDEATTLARAADDTARLADADGWRIGALAVLASCVEEEQARHWIRLAISLAESIGDPRAPELRERLTDLGPEPSRG